VRVRHSVARVGESGLLSFRPGARSIDPAMLIDFAVPVPYLVGAVDTLRKIDPAFLQGVRQIVARWPIDSKYDEAVGDALLERVAEMKDRLGLNARVGLLMTNPGYSPVIRWSEGLTAPDADAALLSELRESETAALLDLGSAVWTPKDYHYRLPSGNHSGTFIRLGDAVRSQHDAFAMASWLVEHLPVDGQLALVLDSPTLVPIALALRFLASSIHGSALTSITFESYPRTQVEVEALLRRAQGAGDRAVAAVLSVNSTGSLLDRLLVSFDRLHLPTIVDVVVNKTRLNVEHLPDGVDVWHSLGDPVESSESECLLCKDAERSRLVQISPWSFDALVLPRPELFVPDITSAGSTRRFWEICDATSCVELGVRPDPGAFRPAGTTLSWKVDWSKFALNASDDHIDEIVGALAFGRADGASGGAQQKAPDVVLVQRTEVDNCGSEFVDRFVAALPGKPTYFVVDREVSQTEWPTDLGLAVDAADHIALLGFGVVSGTSLHRTLAQVHDRRRRTAQYRLSGLVVHGRPTSQRAWETFVNPFGESRSVGWLTFLSEEDRVLDEEMEALQTAAPTTAEAKAFLAERRDLCATGAGSDAAGLWATRTPTGLLHLRPGSWYGEQLRPTATLVAVGAAVHRARTDDRKARRGAPEWRQCDLVAVTRSYYDALIIASVLRCLRPSECWWGASKIEVVRTVSEAVAQFTGSNDLAVLLSEMMLAAAMGKVPNWALAPVVQSAKVLASDSRLSASQRGALQLGLSIVDVSSI
jgi:hypothetical protein